MIVERALVGESVLLGPGTFVFASGWRSHDQYEIRGAGRDQTVLVFQATANQERAAIAWHGSAQLVISDLTIRWAADSGVTIGVLAESGRVELRNVVILGSSTPLTDRGDTGIAFEGSSTGHLLESRFGGHGNSAVSLSEFARVQIVRSEVVDNPGAGLTLGGHSVASIEESSISRNHDGIVAGGDAWFTILTSRIVSNVAAGVRGSGESAGLIVDSLIEDHGQTGLAGADSFWLSLVSSTVRRNSTGLATYGGNPAAKYSILDNAFEETGGHAVTSSVLASIAVAGNTFVDNGLDFGAGALVFSVASRGSAIGNTITRSGGSGILCLERSVAPILGNTLTFNGEYGLLRVEDSRCRESGSTFEGNGLGDSDVWRPE